MCIAIPMQVTQVGNSTAQVTDGSRTLTVDVSLLEAVHTDDFVLVFRGAAIRRVDAEEARRIGAALRCVDEIMAGGTSPALDEAFADILENTGKLPEHLKKHA